MADKVAKNFNTVNRRFTAGDDIGESDVAGDVLTYAQRKETGFVTSAAAAAPDSAPAQKSSFFAKKEGE